MNAPGAAPNWFARVRGWLARTPPAERSGGAAGELAFPPEFLSTVEQLRIAALKALGGGLSEGHRLGAYKGGQLEFHGHRNYAPGDDLKYVDWNSYARHEKPVVKEFAREEAGVLHLLLDASPSMALGSAGGPSKWTAARRIAVLFAHVALSGRDSVQVRLLRGPERPGGPARCEALRSGPAQLRTPEIMERLAGERTDAASGGDPLTLRAAAEAFLRHAPPRGRVILLSDLWFEEADLSAFATRLAAARYDLSGLRLLTAAERAPELNDRVRVESLEEDGVLQLSGGERLAVQYAQAFEAHHAALEQAFTRHGGGLLLSGNDTPLDTLLVETLRARRWVV